MADKNGALQAAHRVEVAAASLHRLRERLRGEIAAKRTEVKSLSGDLSAGDDFEIMAQSDSIAEVDTAEILRDAQELREVEQALERLESGRYGLCERCDKDIPVERLAIQPAAAYCVPCQEAIEAGCAV
ncbi:MAG: TraR/DksA family transcriptional regulator [Burkholderiaceae bacterium]